MAGGSVSKAARRALAGVRWWAWIVVLAAVEGLFVVAVVRPSLNDVFGGDGAQYQRYALNLIHHGVFSEATTAPYHPGVVRSPGYPAFIAALEWLGGAHVVVIQAVQFGILAGIGILVGVICRAVAGPRIGTVAAVL